MSEANPARTTRLADAPSPEPGREAALRPEAARPIGPAPVQIASAPTAEAMAPLPSEVMAPDVAATDAAPTLAPEAAASSSRPTSSGPAPSIPTRLAVPTWLGPLADATAPGVEVALADGDGHVRLQTERSADGLTVVVRFSDPELGALAGLHLRQITDALEAHFAEPVQLSLDQPGADGEGTPSDRGRPAGPEAEAASEAHAPSAPSPSRPLGRTEWIA